MNDLSRIPGFYKLSLDERRHAIAERCELEINELARAVESGGLTPETADKVVENVLGVYSLPFGVATNVRINGQDRLVPMVVEEPSVIAAASNAARMIRQGGGFTAQVVESLMTAQIQLSKVPDPGQAVRALEDAKDGLLQMAASSVPNLIERGGGPKSLSVRDLGRGDVILHLYADCRDAMGANLLNSMAEGIGGEAARLSGGVLGLRILTNLCDRRRTRVNCRVHPSALLLKKGAENVPAPELGGDEIADRIVEASRFAEIDPYRAATHNKGIMNGVDAVVLATGNDFRAVEAGAHAFAARTGQYRPLGVWRRDGEDLVGELELPLALGIVGGTLRVHPLARLALQIAKVTSADDLCLLAASVGLASNLAALRALGTEGIQRGHMSLHARSIAIAAGAISDEVEKVAEIICARGNITVQAAEECLAELRAQ